MMTTSQLETEARQAHAELAQYDNRDLRHSVHLAERYLRTIKEYAATMAAEHVSVGSVVMWRVEGEDQWDNPRRISEIHEGAAWFEDDDSPFGVWVGDLFEAVP